MNLNKNIVLLGMMGSGKSTIGYLLSKNININFFKNMKDVQSGIVIKESQDYYLIYSVYNIRNIQIILDQNIKDEILLQKIHGKIDFFFSVAPVWFDERLI